MRGFLLAAAALMTLFPAVVGLRAQDSWGEVEAAARKGIVKVTVIGDVDGKKVSEVGTGFLTKGRAGPVIVTAAHVLGRDSDWDDVGERLIYIIRDLGLPIAASPVTSNDVKVVVDPNVDIAQVYLTPHDASTLTIAASNTANVAGTKFDVGSWPKANKVAKFQVIDLLSMRLERMHLSGNYEPSHSGSPVLDDRGHVVGMLVERVSSIDSPSTTIGLALPARILMQVLSTVNASSTQKRTDVRSLPRNDVTVADLRCMLSKAGRDTSVTAITVPDICAGSSWFITLWTVCTELISSPCTPLVRTPRLPSFAPLATVTDTYQYCPVGISTP
jgi:hypothetical protein